MSRRPASITQADIARAIRAAKQAGAAEVEVMVAGQDKIIIRMKSTGEQQTALEDGKVRPLDVKKGDKVLFGKYSGQTVKVEGVEYLVMREEDLMGVIEGH
jgi:hypothetical protein